MTLKPGNIDDSFTRHARTPKGRRTLQAILDATYDLVSTRGLAAASQEAIAKQANLTQSAVRHYFPRKDDLLDALFLAGIERLDAELRNELAKGDEDPRARLRGLAALHYDRILQFEDIAYFELASAWARNPVHREFRNSWYKRMGLYYAELIQAVHPEWDAQRCTAVAFQVNTLVLGGWTTMGSSRPFLQRRGRKALKAILLEGVERLIA